MKAKHTESLPTTTADELRKKEYESNSRVLTFDGVYVDGKKVEGLAGGDSFPAKDKNLSCNCDFLDDLIDLTLDPLKSFFSTLSYMEQAPNIDDLWLVGGTLEENARKNLQEILAAIDNHLGRIGILRVSDFTALTMDDPGRADILAVRILQYRNEQTTKPRSKAS